MKKKSELLYEQLKAEILAGTYPVGSQLPRESEFARQNQVALMTLRAALARLESDHLIARLPRSGTFVLSRETGRSRTIQLRIEGYGGELQTERQFVRDLILGAANAAYLKGYQLEVCDCMAEPEKLEAQYRENGFYGIIWDRPPRELYDTITALEAAHVPQVTINRRVSRVPRLCCDYPGAIRQAMCFLRSIGHREVALIDLQDSREVIDERKLEFLNELRFSGVEEPERYLWEQAFPPPPDCWLKLSRLFQSCPDVTAVIVYYTHLAAFCRFAETAQLSIPRDLSVIVWGDSQESVGGRGFSFSSLSESRFEIGSLAVERLGQERGEPAGNSGNELVTPRLVVHGSCGLPRGMKLIQVETNTR